MANINWNEVEEATEYEKVTPGVYSCIITAATDNVVGEYFKVEYDIADGKFHGYYRDLYKSKGFWGGSFIKSYKQKARPFFKGMLTALEMSNTGFKVATYDNDPAKLRGLRLGLVLAEEEYKSKDGDIKKRLYVHQIRSIKAIKEEQIDIPPLKRLAQNTAKSTAQPEYEEFADDDDDLPY